MSHLSHNRWEWNFGKIVHKYEALFHGLSRGVAFYAFYVISRKLINRGKEMIARRDQCRSGSQRPYHRLYYCYKFLFLVYYGVKLSVVVVFVCYTAWEFDESFICLSPWSTLVPNVCREMFWRQKLLNLYFINKLILFFVKAFMHN